MTRLTVSLTLAVVLTACAPSFNPDTYATRAVQQANPADRGTIAGVRSVRVVADGATGAATGAAAGGLVGSQTPGGGLGAAVGALGGAVFGGLVGSAVERAGGNTTAYEYIIRKANGDLVAVTQHEVEPLRVGMRVLVIAGTQARVVIDYTEEEAPAAPAASVPAAAAASVPTAAPAAAAAASPAATGPAAPPAPVWADPAPVPRPAPTTPDIRSYSPEAPTVPL